jgi:hypothetical protein
MIIVYMLKFESKDPLLARVWHRDRAPPFQALHTWSQLFMVTLMDQSC